MRQYLKEDWKKFVINSIFLILTAVALYFAFRSLDIREVTQAFRCVSKGHLVLGCGIGIGYICLEGLIIWLLKKQIEEPGTLFDCLRYSFIGFFFSGITPSSTGGQPMQLFWMTREGSTTGGATVVLLIVAVLYRFSSVVWGVLCSLGQKKVLTDISWQLQGMLWLGVLLNILFVFLVLAAILRPGWILSVAGGLGKVIFRGQEEKQRTWQKKVTDFVEQYKTAGSYITKQKKTIFSCFLLTLLQRLLQFMVLGSLILPDLSTAVLAEFIFAKAYIVMSVEMLPLPGAQGIVELTSLQILQGVSGGYGIQSGIVLERLLSFYIPLFVSGGVVCYTYDKMRIKAGEKR